MKLRRAFSMLELIFVIIVISIIAKFGVEFLANAYNTFLYTQLNNKLQSNSQASVEFIAKRLEYRIKDSIIARDLNTNTFKALADINTDVEDYTVLEWISTDIDSFRGESNPYWSGILDLNHGDANATLLISPETNTSAINNLIQALSGSTIDDAALYFIGSNSDINTSYGWAGALTDQNGSMHPINDDTNISRFIPAVGDFSGIDVYEYYKLSWTANAVVHSSDGNLTFYTDYQPWNGENYLNHGTANLLMEDVDTFKFMGISSLVKIQVCVNSDVVEDFSLCKEKTIY
jgi:prepilin-type N-terminal cleavage/methylation domain-containing protein